MAASPKKRHVVVLQGSFPGGRKNALRQAGKGFA
jgi:hypothetical protein